MRAILLAEEACGVVGMPLPALIDEARQHTQQTNINMGASCCILLLT